MSASSRPPRRRGLPVRRALLLAALAWAGLAPGAGGAPALPRYTVQDLGDLGGAETEARAINDRGEAVGVADTGQVSEYGWPIRHAFLWTAQEGMRDLRPEAGDTTANDINNRGQVVGQAEAPRRAELISCVAVWDTRKAGFPLTSYRNSYYYSEAMAVNDRGAAVGTEDDAAQEPNAYRWWNGKKIVLWSSRWGVAWDVNDRNTAVGQNPTLTSGTYAVAWRSGRLTTLYRANESAEGHPAYAYGVNNREEIVGELESTPVRWRPRGRGWRWERLPTLPGYRFGWANKINDRGQIVGLLRMRDQWEDPPPGDNAQHAVLWQEGRVIDLNDCLPADAGWLLLAANDTNERGQIVGVGLLGGLQSGIRRAFLLTPR